MASFLLPVCLIFTAVYASASSYKSLCLKSRTGNLIKFTAVEDKVCSHLFPEENVVEVLVPRGKWPEFVHQLQSTLRTLNFIKSSEYIPHHITQNGIVMLHDFAADGLVKIAVGRFRYVRPRNFDHLGDLKKQAVELFNNFYDSILMRGTSCSRESTFKALSAHYQSVMELVEKVQSKYVVALSDEDMSVSSDNDTVSQYDPMDATDGEFESDDDVSQVVEAALSAIEKKEIILNSLLPSVCQTWDGDIYDREHRYDYISRLVWLIHSHNRRDYLWEDNCDKIVEQSIPEPVEPDSSPLCSFPNEILVHIFSVSDEFAVAMQLTCKTLNSILSHCSTSNFVYTFYRDAPLARIKRCLAADLTRNENDDAIKQFISSFNGVQILLSVLQNFDNNHQEAIMSKYALTLLKHCSPHEPKDAYIKCVLNKLKSSLKTPVTND